MQQRTLAERVTLQGIGVHSNAPATLTLHPAEPDHGIRFLRTGLPDGVDRTIAAHRDRVTATELCTVVADETGASVSTIEHLMAALVAMGVDNVLAEVDGPEVPIMDGSARPFVDAIRRAGTVDQGVARKMLVVTRPVRVEMGRAFAEWTPRARGFHLDLEIDFPTPLIGRQRRALDVSSALFQAEIAGARTFGFMKDVEFLWSRKLALGASLENTVALDDDRILNPEGLRWSDEFVRHKLLDAMGDLALAGVALQANYRAYMPGHKLNALALEALLADRAAWTIVEPRMAPPRRAVAADGLKLAAVYAAENR